MFLFRVRISGESLWPDLVPGRTYWATSLGAPKTGDYAVFKGPAGAPEFVVKKVEGIENGVYDLRGTVSRSASYKVPKSHILGRLLGV